MDETGKGAFRKALDARRFMEVRQPGGADEGKGRMEDNPKVPRALRDAYREVNRLGEIAMQLEAKIVPPVPPIDASVQEKLAFSEHPNVVSGRALVAFRASEEAWKNAQVAYNKMSELRSKCWDELLTPKKKFGEQGKHKALGIPDSSD